MIVIRVIIIIITRPEWDWQLGARFYV